MPSSGGGAHLSDANVDAQDGFLAPLLEVLSVTPFPPGTQVVTKRYEALNDDYYELYEAHLSCKVMFERLNDTQNELLTSLRLHGALSEDHKALQQTHLCCAGKEAALSEQLGAVENERISA
ncbi:hypothetical protein Tco_0456091 [Tanacetum coccineum]